MGNPFTETARHIQISYCYQSANGANQEGPILTLLATTDGGWADAVRAGYIPGGAGTPDSTCHKTADGFVADWPVSSYRGVQRDDSGLKLPTRSVTWDGPAPIGSRKI